MTYEEKCTFVADLMDGLKDNVLQQLERVPEDWDGHELRWLIQDTVQNQGAWGSCPKHRYKNYRNEVVVRNLA